MSGLRLKLPRIVRGLSARLLVLTIFFVMLGEVLIYVPSIARYRLVYLEERIAASHLASLALKATPDNMVSEDLALELLRSAEVRVVTLKRPESRELMLTEPMPPKIQFIAARQSQNAAGAAQAEDRQSLHVAAKGQALQQTRIRARRGDA